MTTDNNWPEKVFLHQPSDDELGWFESRVEIYVRADIRVYTTEVEYIRADIVAAKEKDALDAAIGIVTAVSKERELAIIRATLEAVKHDYGHTVDAYFREDFMNIDPQEILNSLEKL